VSEQFHTSGSDLAADLVRFADEVAREAGALAIGLRRSELSVATKSSATDIVTNADRSVEQFIRSALAQARPQDAILGEEAGASNPAGAAVRWLVDPIDGTVNYLLGLPHYAVSMAAEVDGEVVAGVVFNPATGGLFEATAGGGAFLDGTRLAGPRQVPLAEAVVATGFAYDAELRAHQGEVVGRLLSAVGNIRRLGSAALDLCALAAGWVDAYYEGPLGEWDFAAGLLIAREAGVSTSGLHGRRAGPWLVAGTHPQLAEEFFDLLTVLDADFSQR
jgi:myo-inositol-1(or 4)-monophosphatase